MSEQFTWKVELEFVGSADEFNELSARLEELPVRLLLPPWPRPIPFPGIWPMPVDKVLDRRHLAELIEDQPRLRLKYVRGIEGGIRDPHVHLHDEVRLLDRGRFKEVVKTMAAEMAQQRVEATTDYIDAIGPLVDMPEFG